MDIGYLIFGIGLLLLLVSYILYRKSLEPQKRYVTARELDSLWTELGKMIVEVTENNTNTAFLRDLDEVVERTYTHLKLPPKSDQAEQHKKQLRHRLRLLREEMMNAKAPYRVEIRKYKLYSLAHLLEVPMPKRKV